MKDLQEVHNSRQQGQTYNDPMGDHQVVLLTFNDPPEDHQEALRCRSLLGVLRYSVLPEGLRVVQIPGVRKVLKVKVEEDIDLPLITKLLESFLYSAYSPEKLTYLLPIPHT